MEGCCESLHSFIKKQPALDHLVSSIVADIVEVCLNYGISGLNVLNCLSLTWADRLIFHFPCAVTAFRSMTK